MARVLVPEDQPVAIRRKPGSNITFINQDAANDCYIDSDYSRLARWPSTASPEGTLLAHAGGEIQWSGYPDSGVLYARSTVVGGMQIEVLP